MFLLVICIMILWTRVSEIKTFNSIQYHYYILFKTSTNANPSHARMVGTVIMKSITSSATVLMVMKAKCANKVSIDLDFE